MANKQRSPDPYIKRIFELAKEQEEQRIRDVIYALDRDRPHLGEQIYVDECDENTGGVATINGISQIDPTCIFLVSFNEVRGLWNWNLLIEEQIELEARFFGRKAEIR